MKKILLIGFLILSFKSFAQTGIGVGSTVHIIFVCDRSSSMEGDRIAQLNNALQQFYEDIKKQDLLKKNIQVAFVAFDSKIDIIGFQKIEANSQAPQFTAQNMTNMAEALETSQQLIPQNKTRCHFDNRRKTQRRDRTSHKRRCKKYQRKSLLRGFRG